MIEKLTGTELKRVLNECGFGFSKSLGQNFLCDERILNMIADDACLTKEQTVLEIGTGAGTLTRVLAGRVKHVVSVEVDKTLLPVHEQTLAGFDNVRVINEDFLKTDLHALVRDELGDGFSVCANLPYYITTPILMKILESGESWRTVTVLVQREVARRMAAAPDTPEYGSLTVAVQYYSMPALCSRIPASCFYPAPNVDSQVIRLTKREKPAVETDDEKLFFSVVHAAFAMRRKTLENNLMASFSLSREEAKEVLVRADLPEKVRGEALNMEALARVSRAVGEIKNQ